MMRWLAIVGLAALVLAGCSTYGVREVLHEAQDPITGARLELYVAKQSSLDDRPIDRKTLKVLTAEQERIIYVESTERDSGLPPRLQVNRAGNQRDASPEDWAAYRDYMRWFEPKDLKEGPAQARREPR